MNNHDFRALIFEVGREVAINRGIPILPTITAPVFACRNCHRLGYASQQESAA